MAKLNLNKNGIKLNKNNSSNSNNNNNKQGEIDLNQIERDIYKDKCLEIEQVLIQDMQDSAIDIEINEQDKAEANKKYKKMKLKKNILYAIVLIFFVCVIIFGIYKTYFKHEYTGPELAKISNYYNNQTNYPQSGVQGYLSANIEKIIGNKLNLNAGIEDLTIGEPKVTRINPKNDELANVYFYIKTTTSTGSDIINCIVPIFWDEEAMEYQIGGDVILTPNKPANNNIKSKENYMLSFKNIGKANDDLTNSSKSFVNNFFTLLYSNQDVSQYYDGITDLEVEDLQFVSLSNYTLYTDKNKNGYNAYCLITLTSSNGINYTTEKYLTIEGSDKNWIITAVL